MSLFTEERPSKKKTNRQKADDVKWANLAPCHWDFILEQYSVVDNSNYSSGLNLLNTTEVNLFYKMYLHY